MKAIASIIGLTMFAAVSASAFTPTEDSLYNGSTYSESGYVFMLNENSGDKTCQENMGVSLLSEESRIYHADTLYQIAEFADKSEIKYIAADESVTLTGYPSFADDVYYDYQWQIQACGINTYWEHGITGEGVRVAVVDTGINIEHEDLRNSTIDAGINACALFDEDYDRMYDTDDLDGHGTAVASIIAASTNNSLGLSGITDKCTVVPVRIHDPSSTCSMNTSALFTALNYVKSLDVDVVNMSVGFSGASDEINEMFKELIADIIDTGVIVVVSIGNNGEADNDVRAISQCENVVTVGAVGYDDTGYYKLPKSSANNTITVSAPGTGIYTASIINDCTYEIREGTSYAAPIVTAAAIGAKQIDPDITASEFIELIKETSVDIDEPGYDINTGYGMIHFGRIYNYLTGYGLQTDQEQSIVTDTIGSFFTPKTDMTGADPGISDNSLQEPAQTGTTAIYDVSSSYSSMTLNVSFSSDAASGLVHCEAFNYLKTKLDVLGVVVAYDDTGRLVSVKHVNGYEPGTTTTDISLRSGYIKYYVWYGIDSPDMFNVSWSYQV